MAPPSPLAGEGRGEGWPRHEPILIAQNLTKTFTLHLQNGLTLPVLRNAALTLHPGECLALVGPSGAGKTTLLRALYGNYRLDAGALRIRHDGAYVDLATAPPRTILAVRARTLGYVSQFLRVVPRVPALAIVAEAEPNRDSARAADLLRALNIPPRLHALPPATFSGGEQQRVNLARGFIGGHPILLLDEPTASLDPANRDIVVDMIRAAKAKGVGIVGIFHDPLVREAVADREHEVLPLQDAA